MPTKKPPGEHAACVQPGGFANPADVLASGEGFGDCGGHDSPAKAINCAAVFADCLSQCRGVHLFASAMVDYCTIRIRESVQSGKFSCCLFAFFMPIVERSMKNCPYF